ncbi:MAG: hypothetical protein GF400_09085 [Candidatus Eisenbacteria bacterium]|nr:hypothetical protein [Candidatus Eisenbacteria bacterium]
MSSAFRVLQAGAGAPGLRSLLVPSAVAVLLTVAATAAPAAFELPFVDARAAALASYGAPPRIGEWEARAAVQSDSTSARRSGRWSGRACAFELFGLRELRGCAVEIERSGDTCLSLSAQRFGTDVYAEQTVGGGLSRRLGEAGRAAVSLRALGLSASGLDEQWTCSFDAAAGVRLLNVVDISCRWSNLGHSRIGGSPVSSATALNAALRTGDALLTGSVLIEGGLEPSSSLGCEFVATPVLVLRAGAGSAPGLFAFGVGFSLPEQVPGAGGSVIDLAWQWHPELGVSAFVSLVFRPPVPDGATRARVRRRGGGGLSGPGRL